MTSGPDDTWHLCSDLWREAPEASWRFGAQAVDCDRYRPRYPESVFDDILEVTDVSVGTEMIEIGAGDRYRDEEPLVRRGVPVTAIEPSPEMAAMAQAKLGDRASVFVGRTESYSGRGPVQLVAAFNAWHWVTPHVAVDRVAELLAPGGCLALLYGQRLSRGGRSPSQSGWPT